MMQQVRRKKWPKGYQLLPLFKLTSALLLVTPTILQRGWLRKHKSKVSQNVHSDSIWESVLKKEFFPNRIKKLFRFIRGFRTDGVRLHLLIERTTNGPFNKENLVKRGYNLSEPTPEVVQNAHRGVFQVTATRNDLAHRTFTGPLNLVAIDPGHKVPITGCSLTLSQDALLHLQGLRDAENHNALEEEIDFHLYRASGWSFGSHNTWKVMTGTSKTEKAEGLRRESSDGVTTDYGRAMNELREQHKKTCDYVKFTSYTVTCLSTLRVRVRELCVPVRSMVKMERLRQRQK